MKKLAYIAASYLVLGPLLPFVLIYYMGRGLSHLAAWCCEYRPWAEYLQDLSYDLFERGQ